MTVLAAADLDRTLIYSRRALLLGEPPADPVCVERHDGRETAFMSRRAADALAGLAAVAEVVPVTSRVPEQYRRVRLPGPPPRHAIASNGAVLYVDDRPDPGWAARVARRLAGGFPVADVWAYMAHVCHPDWTRKLRNADGLYCYAIVATDRLPAGFVDDTAGWAAERGWRTSLQGRKLYWVPDALTKSAAVAEVARRVGAELVLAAGDSLLDVDMLLAADQGIHPRHGELHERGWSAPNVTRTADAGVRAGEQILDWFTRHATAATP